MQRLVASNPVRATPRRDNGKRIPYLFDLSDARHLLEVARTLPNRSRAAYRAQTYETIFALLYGLGLCVGEAVRLRLGDVDLDRDTLLIRETKFSKSRMVPLGPKLAARLRRYIEERHGEAREADRPLFSFTKRGCICPETISQTFHKIVPKLGLRVTPGVSSPRLHDLRHYAACRTMPRNQNERGSEARRTSGRSRTRTSRCGIVRNWIRAASEMPAVRRRAESVWVFL